MKWIKLFHRHKWEWDSSVPIYNVKCTKCGKRDTMLTMGG
jgi:hypothetical protein